MQTALGTVISRLTSAGVRADDSVDVRLQKAVLTLAAVIVSALATYWVTMYLLLGLRLAALFPFTYQVVSVAGLIHLFRTKDARFIRPSQLTMYLLLPFAVQWSLGGFVNSSGVMLWALFAPVGAILIQGLAAARWWFGGYLALTVASGLVDRILSQGAPPIRRG
jgi:hypothetical protein